MEPSLPPAIDALVASISATSLAITNFLRAVRAARADLAAVTRELADLCLVLELLRDEHVVPARMHARTRAVLQSCGVLMDRVAAVIESSDNSSPGARWSARQKRDVGQLWAGLQTYREALALVDEVTNLKPCGRDAPVVAIDYQEVRQASRRILSSIAQLRDNVPQAEAATGDTKKALDLYLDDLTRYTATLSKELLQSQRTPDPRSRSNSSISSTLPRSRLDSDADGTPRPLRASSSTLAPPSETELNPASSQGDLESCGPWFPSGNLVVPYYHNRELPVRPNAPPHEIPIPRRQTPPPPSPNSRLPQRAELPASPPGARRPSRGHHQQDSQSSARTSSQAPASPEQRRPRKSPRPAQLPFSQSGNLALPQGRARPPDPPGPSAPPVASPEKWATSVYVPESPASTTSARPSQRNSAMSSDGTSFQTSSDYASSWTMYRSSVSTAGTASAVDSYSGAPSPKLAPFRQSSAAQNTTTNTPRPDTASTVSSITSSIRDRIPRFRSVRRAFTPSDAGPPPNKRHSKTSSGSSTIERTSTMGSASGPPAPAPTTPLPAPPRPPPDSPSPNRHTLDIVPADSLCEPKTPETLHLDISPTNSFLATQHANHSIKIWSVTTGAAESTISYRAKFQAGPRSRMYFLRSHAILSEAMTLVAITTSFGNTIEVWNWAKKKRVQAIDHAARWACVRGDVFQAGTRPLAVYRSETDHIDLFSASRDPGAKKMLVPSRRIDMGQSGLPFLPHFPDLAYSATGPTLVGAAGPRPRALPDQQQCLLMAWQIDGSDDSGDQAYRWVVPPQPELLGALPASLACYGSLAVSVWFPANYRYIVTARGQWRRVPVAAAELHVVAWDLATNQTRLFSVPHQGGPFCVSPDCQLVAHCDLERGRFVVRDVAAGGTVLWEGGADEWASRKTTAGGTNPPRQLTELDKVTALQFSDDGGMLFVGDKEGAIGIYEVKGS